MKQDPIHALEAIMQNCKCDITRAYVRDWIHNFVEVAQVQEISSHEIGKNKEHAKYIESKMLQRMISFLVGNPDILERDTQWGKERRLQVYVLKDKRNA
jgi:hypothetical protein